MMVHLEYNHRVEFIKIKATQQSAATKSKTKDPGQPTIGNSFEKAQPLLQSSTRWKTLTASVCHCIAKDMMPFSTVSNVGFQRMLRTFEPRYVLLDRKTITNHYMPEIHEKVKRSMKKTMQQGLTYFSLTTDAWTSRANHSYVTHTVHYIDEHWKLCSRVLDTCEITTEHSAANLADELQNTLLKWDLSDEKLMAVTSDNARNIVDAIENLSWQHFGCFAHTVQLRVKKIMQVAQVSKHLDVVVIWLPIFITLAIRPMF